MIKQEIMAGVEGYTKVRLVAKNTVRYEIDKDIYIRFYRTDILLFPKDGESVIFNTGGYQTHTTRVRLNRFQGIARIYQKDWFWYFDTDKITGGIFYDGLTLAI